jgi:hypothetical protein
MAESLIHNYFVQAEVAARMMAEDLPNHEDDCVIWLMPDACDCGRKGVPWPPPKT